MTSYYETRLPPPYEQPPAYEQQRLQSPPEYDCTVCLSSHFLFKAELRHPSHTARDRKWTKVRAELRGTFLTLRSQNQRKTSHVFTDRTYTLQAADAGLAADYTRRSFVLRVRAEGSQFLLAASSYVTLLDWVDKLNTAIDISLPLEHREQQECSSLPRPTCSVCKPKLSDSIKRRYREIRHASRSKHTWLNQIHTDSEEGLTQPVSELEEWINGSIKASGEAQRVLDRRSSVQPTSTTACTRIANCSRARCCRLNASKRPISIAHMTSTVPALAVARSSLNVAPLVLADEKWRPEVVRSTVSQRLRYARRCTRTLLFDDPWKGALFGDEGRCIVVTTPQVAKKLASRDAVVDEPAKHR